MQAKPSLHNAVPVAVLQPHGCTGGAGTGRYLTKRYNGVGIEEVFVGAVARTQDAITGRPLLRTTLHLDEGCLRSILTRNSSPERRARHSHGEELRKFHSNAVPVLKRGGVRWLLDTECAQYKLSWIYERISGATIVRGCTCKAAVHRSLAAPVPL
eukprot:NODE_1010_length_1064_cov_52.752401_g966_i0.p1 GENE.NODE_1010_length_1064_cov_52.752401_g966_i0~~NODE_1010_length_1064_cov_52.752401_g966_i0.p1  ORF type:complete len:156 (+),score=11.00 NODE_1010_length_1064_cov_52.752401_g966_i0:291-758(+)